MRAATALLLFYFPLFIFILNDVYCMIRDDPSYFKNQTNVHYCKNYTHYIANRSNSRYTHKQDLCNLPSHTGPIIPNGTFINMTHKLVYIDNASTYWDFFAETRDFNISFPPINNINPFNMSLLHISTQRNTHNQTHLTCRMNYGKNNKTEKHINADESNKLIEDWFYCCCPRELINQENTYVLNTFLTLLRPGVAQYTSPFG